VPPGEQGERVLLTIFSRRTQPLIRYEISDLLRVSEEKCDCGRPFRCMAEIEGRREDILYFPARNDSKRVVALHPNVFDRLMESVPATGWQIVHDEQGVGVNLTGLRDEVELSRVEAGMLRLFEGKGVAAPPVRVNCVSELRRGKTGKAPLVLSLTQRNLL
jgi:phenylacetate-CoA ligase